MNFEVHRQAESNPKLIKVKIDELANLCTNKRYRIMEFCGGHTHSFFRSGLAGMVKPFIDLVHGPGCPVCVLPPGRVGMLLDLIENRDDVIVATYADMMRIQTLEGRSLLKSGKRAIMVYSALDVINIAEKNPDKEIVFAAIGFETTTPPTALLLDKIVKNKIQNITIFCNHVLTSPAIYGVMDLLDEETSPDGIIGPGHVSMVLGSKAYDVVSQKIQRPIVISGFEPLDLIDSLIELVKQIRKNKNDVSNLYSHVVKPLGNEKAQKLISKYFEVRPSFEWRGVGSLKESALQIKGEYSAYDCEKKFNLKDTHLNEHPQCKCPMILLGKSSPLDCKLFDKACTPSTPLGSCMVSSEGACNAYYNYGVEK
ncbi:MAG: hydrogenase formation protein HypD [Bacteriovoracaceae bacterium]|nr:hydrogenase formation protein HypD [Bacteriovoracaceae bacterium]